MNDTVTKLMGMIDEHARNASEATRMDYETWHLKSTVKRAFDDVQTSRQALQDELTRLFTPLTDEQIEKGVKAWFENDIVSGQHPFSRRMRAAINAAHGITGGSKRCPLCNYQHGHQIGCENNPVDIALQHGITGEGK